MSETTTTTPAAESPQLAFADAHVPKLQAGKYKLEISQTLQATGADEATTVDADFKDATFNFYVQGERFHLTPQEVHSVFPPAGSLGDHDDVLPHLIINRSTLPWERTPIKSGHDQEKNPLPWLALMVFQEGDLQPQQPPKLQREAANGFIFSLENIQQLDGSKLKEGETKAAQKITLPDDQSIKVLPGPDLDLDEEVDQSIEVLPGPDLDLDEEIGATGEDRINLIFVKKALAAQLIPLKAADLKYRVHTRHDVELSGDGNEKAVIVANRLPASGASTIVHLVSLEHRYDADGNFQFWQKKEVSPEALVPFISLKSWRFTCLPGGKTFRGHMTALSEQTLSSVRLPATGNEVADRFLTQGYTPFPHYFREGSKSVSWYRGPLAPGKIGVETSLPITPLATFLNGETTSLKFNLPLAKGGDQLLQYHGDVGLFDVTYAAAWELGRLLALRNQGFSTQLARWKKSHRRAQAMAVKEETHKHIPYAGPGKLAEVQTPRNWLNSLMALEGVPFNYLVPDERMLPVESLRFFRLNQHWMASLLDGALSIGGKVGAAATPELLAELATYQSGCLLRSSVVAGYPGLHLTTGPEDQLPAVRRQLAPNLLICLFKEPPQQVNFFLQAEVLHFGFDPVKKGYQKSFRDATGKESGAPQAILLREGSKTIVDFPDLVGKLEKHLGEPPSSAQFALSLIKGSEKFAWSVT